MPTVDARSEVMAHPDDVDFGAAGTVATWTDEGLDVVYCVVTDGEAGGSDRSLSRAEGGAAPRGATAVAKVVGVTQLHFLGQPDGPFEPRSSSATTSRSVIGIVRPSPRARAIPQRNFQRIYASHPTAWRPAKRPSGGMYPDARRPVPRFPSCSTRGSSMDSARGLDDGRLGAHTWVDITDTFDRKVDTLRAHRRPDLPHGEPRRLPTRLAAAQAGPAALTRASAEGFQVIQTG